METPVRENSKNWSTPVHDNIDAVSFDEHCNAIPVFKEQCD